MKQPKSQSTMRNKMTKRIMFPTVRHNKQAAKLQQIQFSDKSQLFFNMNLLPFDVNLFQQNYSCTKILATSSEVTINNQNVCTVKHQLNRGQNEWLGIKLGQNYSKIKVKKFGDQNVFGKNQIFSDISSLKSEKCQIIEIRETKKKLSKTSNANQQKARDIKKFVSNLMSKKINSRRSQSKEPQLCKNLNIRRNSGLMKNKLIGYNQSEIKAQISMHKITGPSTAISSFRKDIINESKYTKTSEKQTNISCDQNISHAKNLRPSNISVQSSQYLKMKLKFDTQPYFRNTGSFQSSEVGSTFNCQLSKIKGDEPSNTLENKSQHKSQEQQSVEQQIKRSQLSMSANQFSSKNFNKAHQAQKDDDSSSCYESEQLDSTEVKKQKQKNQNINLQFSGTLYESRYQ